MAKTIAEQKELWKDGFVPNENHYSDLFDTIEEVSAGTTKTRLEQNRPIEEFFGFGGEEFLDPNRIILSNPMNQNDTIIDVSISYTTYIQGDIEMSVESIDDPVNTGRKALRIVSIKDGRSDFSLSGTFEFFGNATDTKAFNFDGSTPEILIDNIDPRLAGVGMRFVNTKESDLTCTNVATSQEIKTFGTSIVFGNSFTYSEYINEGDTTVVREGKYTSSKRNSYLVPKNKIGFDSENNIVFDADGLTYFFLLPEAEKLVNIKIEYMESPTS
ncbi:hypothetical protein [Aquimarina algiphila]|uniref:Uncharacterized protein n=1 Tax=Aquimarina algiphila TaxID=2047982 RepID=A0A554VEZ3_9FLAO|nr:hypothetical protein [Aquimarina algiphila]TSE05682.1 hypothetical protein FOF46_21885 [Aquimarina algiphila]